MRPPVLPHDAPPPSASSASMVRVAKRVREAGGETVHVELPLAATPYAVLPQVITLRRRDGLVRLPIGSNHYYWWVDDTGRHWVTGNVPC